VRTNKNTTLNQASQLIRSAHYPLLICHLDPDADAIGSLTGLGRALRQIGLQPVIACPDPLPPRFNYIPGAEAVVPHVSVPFDLVISLDGSDLERLGHFPHMPAFSSQPLLNIDHHLPNLNFGDVNLVAPQASSTAEVVLRLLEYMPVLLDTEIATALLAGIVTDTRGFRTNNVNAQVMRAALRLMEAGASLPYITSHSLDRRSAAELRLWGAALERLQIENRVIWTTIPLETRRTVGHVGHGNAGLVSFLISADDVDAALVFVERQDRHIEVSLRAMPGFDVAQVALHFGGGGHALAAGCTIPGPIESAQAHMLAALQADLARQRKSHA